MRLSKKSSLTTICNNLKTMQKANENIKLKWRESKNNKRKNIPKKSVKTRPSEKRPEGFPGKVIP